MTDRDRLKALLVDRSVRVGEFVLASGKTSDYYVDARTTTMSAEGQRLVGLVAFALIRDQEITATHVGGMTMGADPVAYAIAHRSALEGRPLDGFSVRKEPKEHGTRQQVEGGVGDGSLCLLVEDSMTTGNSTLKAVEAVRSVGAKVVGVLTLIDREEGARELYAERGIPFYSLFTGSELKAAAR